MIAVSKRVGRRGVATALFVITGASPLIAAAQAPVTAERGAELAAEIQEMLATTFQTSSDRVTIDQDGPFTLSAMDDGYEGTLPGLSVRTTTPSMITEYRFPAVSVIVRETSSGLIALETVGDAATARFDMLPGDAATTHVSPEFQPGSIDIHWNAHQGRLLIDPDLDLYVEADVAFEGLDVLLRFGPGILPDVSAERLVITSRSTEGPAGRHDMSDVVDVTGFEAAHGKSRLAVGEARFDMTANDVDLQNTLAWFDDLIAAMDRAMDGAAIDHAVLQELADSSAGLWGDFSSSVVLSDVVISASSTEQVRFDGMRLSTGVIDGATVVGGSFGLGFSGIVVEPAPEADVLIPTAFDLDVSVDGVSRDRLAQALIGYFIDFGGAANADAFVDQFGETMGALFTAPGVTYVLGPIRYETVPMTSELTLSISANPEAVLGIVAEGEAWMSGAAEMIGTLSDLGGEAASAGMMIAMIRGLGRVEDGPDGETVHHFAIEIDRDGSFLVNGTNFGPMVFNLQ